MAGPWLDFGSPAFYLRSQLRLLAAAKGRTRAGSLLDAGVRDGRCALEWLARWWERGSASALVARVERSVLWPGARVGEGARVVGCVVTGGARIAAGAHVAGEIVLTSSREPLR